jgi:hypothetical protein
MTYSNGVFRIKPVLPFSLAILAATVLLADLPASQPSQPEEKSQQAIAVIRRLSTSNHLRLSTEGEQPLRKFHFVFRLSSEPKGGEPQYTNYVVVKEGDRLGILAVSGDGLPYAYLTEGFMVIADRTTPGGLLIDREGAPIFVLRASAQDGTLQFQMAHAGRAVKGRVDVELASLLRGTEPNLRKAALDRTTGNLIATTDRTALMLSLPAFARPADFDVRSFVIRTQTGQTLAFLDPAIGTEPPFDPVQGTADAVEKLGVPIRTMQEKERGKLPMTVPPDFGKDPKERETASRLMTVFVQTMPSSGQGNGNP